MPHHTPLIMTLVSALVLAYLAGMLHTACACRRSSVT
jgi:predicted Kef-type K+ transport protein